MLFIAFIVALIVGLAAADYGNLRKAAPRNVTLGFCDYEDTCNVGGIDGVCVSMSSGCCNGGTDTSGLCPGSSDIRCCTNNACSTPSGSGTCKQTSACSGTSIPGYCSGPSDIQCCVGGGNGCILGTVSGCDSSGTTMGITNQIVAELNSMGYSFRGLNSNWVHCASDMTCTLQNSAADALEKAAQSVNDYITLNSAFRSSAEQYVLYNFYNQGRCGITLAAAPGSSNHEGGSAIDTSYYSYWEPILGNYGWVHSYPSSDPVHFDYTGASNIASMNLLAFQRLWNRHNPSSQISEDGQYGPQTENALYWSPCGGW